ncbi:EAL domain-containing protein [Vogesella sp. DC21W]|uniref:EAL domain-containing protein n=1 Tax=Vogesella aquatica TaxID=2984206 RepID=A0ABT5IXN8_9NEIS|nr:EAL domain-containing protein [Vogesella aquatica]MDC7717227.1 EAL domain-containing protein [Vogesella aquatica]
MPQQRFPLARTVSHQMFWLQSLLVVLLLSAMAFLHYYNDGQATLLAEESRRHAREQQQLGDTVSRLGDLHNRLILLVEEQEAEQLNPADIVRRKLSLQQALNQLTQDTLALGEQTRQSPALAGLVRDIQADLLRYHAQAGSLLQLLPSETEAAEDQALVISRRVTGDIEKLRKLARKQRDMSIRHFETSLQATLHTGHQLQNILLGLLLAALALIGWRMHRIGRNLQHTEALLMALGHGDTSMEPPLGDALFQPVFNALRRFRELLLNQQALLASSEAQQQKLECMVDERTAHLQQANRQLEDEISQRQQAEKRRRLYEMVFEHTEDAVIITTPDTHIVAANPAYQLMTGMTLDELCGKRPPIARSGHHDRQFYQQLWQELAIAGRWQGEIVNRHTDGSLVHALLAINAATEPDGTVTHYVGILSDITQLKLAENQLRRLAYYDPLTALPNRVLLKDRLAHEIDIAREEKRSFATMLLDLDRFKYVNDTLGHKAGDELLMDVAERLRGTVRLEDTVARLSGDEFCIILRDCSPSQVARTAEAIVTVLNLPFRLEARDAEVGASIGIAMFPGDGESSENLMKNADAAMYQAKALGRNRYCFFEPAIEARLRDEMELFTQLRHAIEEQQFVLHYQPIIPLAEGLGSYGEALLRWPGGGSQASPGVFIPFAEQHGLIEGIGDFVLEAASHFVATSIEQGLPQSISINLSARQLALSDLPERLSQAVSKHGIPASAIELELTESSLIQNLQAISVTLTRLRQAGFRIAIDDFGAGYSSLNYLVELPVDKVKIDQRFIWSLFNSPRNQAVVKAILSLAHTIGIQTVAEGVETAEQLAFLQAHGCHYVQGYYLARPMSQQDFLTFQQLGTANMTPAG